MKYFIKLSKDGSFDPLEGVYEIDERFHVEVLKVMNRLIEHGRAKQL